MASCIAAELAKGSAMLQAVQVFFFFFFFSSVLPAFLLIDTWRNTINCMDILQILQEAKAFVESALHYSKDMAIGNGPQGPFDHLFRLKSPHYNVGATPRFNPDDLFLYAVTDSRMNKKWGRSITDAVQAAIEGGATIIQLRSVTWSLTLSISKLNISIPSTFFLF